jgi:FKBP-type peptidyl-prolyl cis-trans isomerase
VKIKLNGWLNNGKQIQKNYIGEITLGSRTVIAGIRYALEGMKKNGIRKVKISPHLAYGKQGVVNLIPSHALLIYQIEIVDIIK